MGKSIYEQICDNITDGVLDNNFCIDEESYEEGAFRWAPGTWDGVCIYHMSDADLDASATKEMSRALKCAAQGDVAGADEKFAEWCKEHRAINAIDMLQNYVIRHKKQLDPNAVHSTALYLMLHSENIECVKIGLEFMELFGEPQDDIKEIIRRIGLYDEFTIFAV